MYLQMYNVPIVPISSYIVVKINPIWTLKHYKSENRLNG